VGDLQVYDLLAIVDRFATGFAALPELIPGRADYRVLIASSRLVRAYSVVGQLAPDGAVELIAIEFDLGADWS